MSDSFAITGASLSALSEEYRAISNNLANVSTAGFKKQVSQFRQVLRQATEAGPQASGGGSIPGKSVVQGVLNKDFSQGSLEKTDRPLDVAIEGEGFFVIETPVGPRYTRNGVFRVNSEQQLVDGVGRTVAGTAGPIVIPEDADLTKVFIGRDGTVSSGEKQIGKIELVTFDNPRELIPLGNSAYKASNKIKPIPVKQVTVHQGFREQSNVSAIEELVNLIRITRMYEANVKSINEQDRRMKTLLAQARS